MPSPTARPGERAAVPQADGLFHIVEDAFVITRSKGVLKQARLYHRRGFLYVGISGGFAQLSSSGGTSAPNVSYEEIVGYEPAGADRLGRPVHIDPKLIEHVAVPQLAGPKD